MMGILTDDMTRLVGEINALRHERGVLMNDLWDGAKELEDSVFAMLHGFHKTHAGVAKRLKADLKTFRRNLKSKVNKMEADFHKAHSKMAHRTMAERAAFVSDLNETVADLRQGFASDLGGAHRAWYGQGA